MKGNSETPKIPDGQQDKRSVILEAANGDHAVVVQLEFPVDKLLTLQAQRIPTSHTVTPRGMARTIAASYIGCSPRKFDYLVDSGEMPKPRLIGVKKVWDRVELDDFFESLPRPQTHDDKNEWDEDESGD